MHLHDRVIRAGFFGRAQFVMRYSRDQRLFYEGLLLLADDSHCLLDDPWEFKMHLFPLDADIAPETLAAWRDAFVADGKLVPYEAEGKRCLYLRNGPEHQSQQQNLERPEVPLPAWVRWTPYPRNPYRGTYGFGEPVAAEELSDPSLRTKRPIASIKATLSAGLGLNQDLDRDRDGDTGKGDPPTDPPASAGGAADGSPGADAPPSPAAEVDQTEPDRPAEPSATAPAIPGLAEDPLLRALTALRLLPCYHAKADDLTWLSGVAGHAPSVPNVAREIEKCRDWWAPRDAKPRAKTPNWRLRLDNWLENAEKRARRDKPPARAAPAPGSFDDPAVQADLLRPRQPPPPEYRLGVMRP